MTYDTKLIDRIREYLMRFSNLEIEEKKMFRGITFMINGKMCVSVSGENLMCRFDPDLTETIAERTGFLPMKMRGKEFRGYCYVEPTGFNSKRDFEYWINLCLEFNARAKASKHRLTKPTG